MYTVPDKNMIESEIVPYIQKKDNESIKKSHKTYHFNFEIAHIIRFCFAHISYKNITVTMSMLRFLKSSDQKIIQFTYAQFQS